MQRAVAGGVSPLTGAGRSARDAAMLPSALLECPARIKRARISGVAGYVERSGMDNRGRAVDVCCAAAQRVDLERQSVGMLGRILR